MSLCVEMPSPQPKLGRALRAASGCRVRQTGSYLLFSMNANTGALFVRARPGETIWDLVYLCAPKELEERSDRVSETVSRAL